MVRKALVKILVLSLVGIITIAADTGRINADVNLDSQPGIVVEVKQLGEVEVGNCKFTIKNVSESNDNGIRKAQAGHKFLCINLIVENYAAKEQQITSVMVFTLKGSNNKQYNVAVPEGLDSINGLVPAKAAVSGNIWFEVPQDEKLLRLNIHHTLQEKQADSVGIYLKTAESRMQNNNEKISGYTIGNDIIVDNLTFSIDCTSTTGEKASGKADKAYKHLNIDLSVKNNGLKEEQLTSAMVFKLIDETGQVYNAYLPEEKGLNGTLKPKDEISGRVSFKVDAEKKNYTLEIKPWAYKASKGIIDIGIIE